VDGLPVVEIGPGGGVLTRLLLEGGADRVIACEIDPSWAFALRRRLPDARCQLAVGDACDLRYERVPVGARIAGNLPYNGATRIIARVLERSPVGTRAAFLVQREVADRLTASAGEGAYGALSVLTRAQARGRRLGLVMPGSFVPPPAVTSAFVGLERVRSAVADEEWREFRALVRTTFRHRRKTLLNNLGSAIGRTAAREVLSTLGLPPMVRAERLELEEFVALFREVKRRRGGPPAA